MTDKITDLELEKARRNCNAAEVGVGTQLRKTLEDLESYGWDKCLIVLHRKDGEDGFRVDLRLAGCTTLEARGLMLTWIKEEILD